MGAPHLGDRVVPVAHEDVLVEPCRAFSLDPVKGSLALHHISRELLEEEPTKRSRVARVAREQRALDRLGQVDEAENGPIEVREVGPKEGLLIRGEDQGFEGEEVSWVGAGQGP